jgi:isopentenyldiphosphate isomerase
MTDIKYPIVDDSDNIIGEALKDEAYKKGLQLRSIQIFVFDLSGRLFVQKRASTKKRFPSYLCASVAGHVEPNENYLEAAKRELKEEMGIDESVDFLCKEKTPIGDDQFAMMAHFTAQTSSEIKLQEDEIDDGDFYTIDEIKKLIDEGGLFTPSFLYSFGKIKKDNLKV